MTSLCASLFTAAGNTITVTAKNLKTSHEPVHQSSSQTCVAIDPEKDQWFCHSCQIGGGPVQAFMSLQGCAYAEAEAAVQAMGGAPKAAGRKAPAAATLLRIADQATLVYTAEDQRFARVRVDTHAELLSIGERGSGFREWLVRAFRQETGAVPNTTAVSQVMEVLAAECRFAGAVCEVHTRLAYADNAIFYDLGTPTREAVRITADGWRAVPSLELPVYFRRPRGMQPLPAPDPTGTMEHFTQLLPAMDDASRLLVTGWAIGTFLPEGAFAHLAIHGEQGSAKTTLTRMLRQLLDPNKAPVRSTPKDEHALLIAAQNGSIVALENLSHLPDWLSDALCCLSTGAGMGTRMLYTDDEECIFSVKRPTVLNGISEVAVRGDLIDRCLFITLPTIEEAQRINESAVWRHFEAARAKALGALLTAVSTALRRRNTVQLGALPRMADFATWVEAAAPALGWEQGAFLQAYCENRQAATSIELDASSVAPTLLSYLECVLAVDTMRMKNLLEALTSQLTDSGKKPTPKSWPKSPQSLRYHLQRLAPALRRQGWRIAFSPPTNHGSFVSIEPCNQPADTETAPEDTDSERQAEKSSSPANSLKYSERDELCDERDELFCPEKSSSSANSFKHNRSDELDELDELSLPLSVGGNKEEEEKGIEWSKSGGREEERVKVCESSSSSSSSPHALYSDELAGDELGDELSSAPKSSSRSIEVGASADLPAVEYITTTARLEALLPMLLTAPQIGLDIETTGLDPHQHRIRLVQLATPEQTLVIDASHCALLTLAPLLRQPETVFLGHNLKFDTKFLAAVGLPWPAQLRDTMLEAQLLGAGTDDGLLSHSGLAAVVQRYLGLTVAKEAQKSDWSGALSPAQLTYAARDAALLLPLAAALAAATRAAGLARVCTLEAACVPALAWMELTGVPVDAQHWAEQGQYEANRATALEAELYATLRRSANGQATLLPEAVNWSSPQQVLAVLHRLGHQVTGTGSDVLASLAATEPLVALLLEYREAKKRAGTYGTAWLHQHCHSLTGRVHADYLQLGSVAGRMSCTRPNMQNLPRSAAYRTRIRPDEGWCIVKADYSQIELRIAALMTQEPAMLAAFAAGKDLHRLTASRVLGLAAGAVTGAHRQLAKALNFGLLYGMGAEGLQQYAFNTFHVALTPADAVQHRQAFFALYPALRQWHQATGEALKKSGSALDTRTLTDRRRLGVARYTEAINTPVQGSGADGLKLAMGRLFAHRHEVPDARLILAVHDELVAECRVFDAAATAAWLRRHMVAAMEEIVGDGVPIVVDTTIGQDWAGTPLAPAQA